MRIGIIGHFGGHEKFTDGQTVKTLTLYQSFVQHGVNGGKIDKIDTYYIKQNPIRFIVEFLSCMLKDKKVVVLLSSNGRRVLFPILSFMQRYMGKEIYHYGIGGRLAREVGEKPAWKRHVASFSGNWMESRELVDALHVQGINNAVFIPNFKQIRPVNIDQLDMEAKRPFRFCTFSRVMEEKGISDAIHAVCKINEDAGSTLAELDIYGPVSDGYRENLMELLQNSNSACQYCGVIESNQSVEALKDYYCLLFPTHWKHEGIPGTIIDALTAGIPVIARRWQYCDEMLTDGETGYVYAFECPELLMDKMVDAMNHPERTMRMKSACLKAAETYSEPVVLQRICSEMKLQ